MKRRIFTMIIKYVLYQLLKKWLTGFGSDLCSLVLQDIRRRIFLSIYLCLRFGGGMNLAAFVFLHDCFFDVYDLYWGNFMGSLMRSSLVLFSWSLVLAESW